MSRFQYYTMEKLIRFFLEQGKEGECWDFKQEWHDKTEDLIKDIICFANTVHDENCYLIFGVSDDLEIKGMTKKRRKQACIIDAISHLSFAGDNYPKISVETIKYEGVDLDILVIYNTDKTPIYLKKTYGNMREGCIYLRTGDKNTPNNGNADISDIENLWRKRLGLTKPPLEYIYDRMHNKLEWVDSEYTFYNIFKPEYTIEVISEEGDDRETDEFYSYAMANEKTSFQTLNIKYQNTILDSYQTVVLDSGRLHIPVPEWGYICHDKYGQSKYCYKYYVAGSKRYRVFTFLYNRGNDEEHYAYDNLKNVVLFFFSDEERIAFEVYLEGHQDLVTEKIESVDRYDYINTGNENKTALYKERLRTGITLNQLLVEWRNSKK